MELLLWLYLFDNRWFFNIKLPSKIYKFLWCIPIFINFMLLSTGVYYFNFVDDSKCTNSLQIWIYHRTFFSVLIIINILIFLKKIQSLIEEEKLQIQDTTKFFNLEQLFLHAKHNNQSNLSFWIRRKSLVSTPGILLLIQGFISLYYSYLIKNLITNQYFRSCDFKIEKALGFHSFSIWYGNVLLIIVFCVMIKIKIFHFVMGMYFPRKYAYFMKNITKVFNEKRKALFNLGLFNFIKKTKYSHKDGLFKKKNIAYDQIYSKNYNSNSSKIYDCRNESKNTNSDLELYDHYKSKFTN